VSAPRRIYVASSWRNDFQPGVVASLRGQGHEVYDFKNPPSRAGFGWEQLAMGTAASWDNRAARAALDHPIARAGFKSDHDAMEWADTFVLVLPCGRSAHLEMGWACGRGKRTIIYAPRGTVNEPELMYLEAECIAVTFEEMCDAVSGVYHPGVLTAAASLKVAA